MNLAYHFKQLSLWIEYNVRYFSNTPWDTGISPPELVEFIHNHTPGRVLDLGCGTGTNLVTLAKNGWEVVGVDFAVKGVAAARRRFKHEGIKGQVMYGDVTDLHELNSKFDLILDIGCFHGLSEQGKLKYITNVQRLLSDDGFLLMYARYMLTEEKPGMQEIDILHFSDGMTLIDRHECVDGRKRKSVWLTFMNGLGRSS